MALRLEETSRTVDTIQHVVARDNVLYRFYFEVAWTLTGSCDPNGLVGENVWNVDRPRPITMIEFVENRR